MSDVKNYEVTSHYGKELLEQIDNELPRIKTRNQDSHGNREYEPNKMLDEKVKALLVNLHLSQFGYTIWRISSPITIQNTTGPGYIIPIRTLGSPSLDPGGPQRPGWYTYYPITAKLTPELDCIFVAKRKE